ncbi:MAG: hypothetical protein V4628_16015 [Pseudomonadota bacterium]
MPPKITALHIKFLHNIVPASIKKPFSLVHQWLCLDVYFFSSPDNVSEKLHCAFLGMNGGRARCWGKRVCGDDAIETTGEKIWIWQLESYLAKHKPECQLVMIETSKLGEIFLRNKDGFKLPMWIQLALDSTKTLKELNKASYRLEGEIPRLIRKNKLGHELSTNHDELDVFIDQMHLPFISGRHGDSAFYSSRQDIHKVFEQSELIYITQEGNRIAGVMLHAENGMATLRFSGVKDARPEYYRSGSVACFYYFGLLRAMEKGMSCFNFGGSSPFLTDNITYFKLSFKPYVMENTHLADHFIKMMFRKQDLALTRFLQTHPFIAMSEEKKFERHVFANAAFIETADQFDELFKKIQCDNLASTVVHVQGDLERVANIASQSAQSRTPLVCEKWDLSQID